MSKLGKDFELGYAETVLLEAIRSVRRVGAFTLIWASENRPHMKWRATCNNPRWDCINPSSPRILIGYGATPREALQKLADELRLKNVL